MDAAAVAMTDEQKIFFDLRGWLLLPSILSDDDIEEMKAEVYAGAKRSYEGALQRLLDHPAIVGILSEILTEGLDDIKEPEQQSAEQQQPHDDL